jgi:hypothetical protein
MGPVVCARYDIDDGMRHKVYVSSTYEDLKALRRRVLMAIDKLPDFEAVGMEHYLAGHAAPLERCLRDVRESDMYVGLLGSRSGSIAPGHAKTFTRLEYEEAFAANKPCLFFLLPDEPARAATDQERQQVAELRALAGRHTHKIVERPEELGEWVMASLIEAAHGEPHVHVRSAEGGWDLLPYACDRILQCQELQLALVGPESKPGRRVPIVAIHGYPDHAPDKFSDWLREEMFAELSGRADARPLQFRWPIHLKSGPDFLRLLTLNLAEAAQIPRSTDASVVRQMLSEHPAPFYLSTSLSVDYTDSNEADRLRALQAFLQPWAGLDNAPLGVLLWIVYKPPRRRWYGLLGEDGRNQRMREALGTLQPGQLLSELGNVREDDALQWSQRKDVLRRGRQAGQDLPALVRRIFAADGGEGLPMMQIAPELAKLLLPSTGPEQS